MNLIWPWFLILLTLIPILIGVYIWMLRRKRYTVRYSSLSIVREALPRYSQIRRHLPFALFLLALASLVLALGRPVSLVTVPTDQTTIILALDVSGSMRARDIEPSRLEAAQSAALSFIEKQKSSIQIGIVAFSGFGELVQPPTRNQDELKAAIMNLTTGRRTAIGSGILKSIDAIAEIDKNVAPSDNDLSNSTPIPPVPTGAFAPDIIVLLTDGVSNAGVLPLDAAKQAADRGVRIYTIGYGTSNGIIPFTGSSPSQGGDPLGGNNPSFGAGFRTGIDETVLKKVADLTGGTYYSASTAGELHNVFQKLPTYLIMKHDTIEISVFFVAAGALLAALAVGLSLLWHPLP
jgi:Ca-activated chloride channel homolog